MNTEQETKLLLASPPVAETVLSIQFADLQNWTSVHHGLFFNLIRSDFPVYRQANDQPAIIETFPATLDQSIRVELSGNPRPGCAVYINDNETGLIRIQRNRFSYHWVGQNKELYTGYDSNRTHCLQLLEQFESFCKQEGIGVVLPALCEVTYVNYVVPNPDQGIPQLFREAFGVNLGDFELAELNRTRVLGNNEGRLYAEISSADRGGLSMLQFKLTTRVRHVSDSLSDTLDKGHDWLIDGFLQLTSERFRKEVWGSNA